MEMGKGKSKCQIIEEYQCQDALTVELHIVTRDLAIPIGASWFQWQQEQVVVMLN